VAALLCGGSALAAVAAAPVLAAAPATPPRLRPRGGGGSRTIEGWCGLCLVVLPLAAEYAALRVLVLRSEPLAWLGTLVAANAVAFMWLAGVMAATLALVARGSAGASTPLLITRKAFHVAALVLFAPPVLHALARGSSLAFLQVASAGALQLAPGKPVLVESLRRLRTPPPSRKLELVKPPPPVVEVSDSDIIETPFDELAEEVGGECVTDPFCPVFQWLEETPDAGAPPLPPGLSTVIDRPRNAEGRGRPRPSRTRR
jgi:hypothetical protein